MIKESMGYRGSGGMMMVNYPINADGNMPLNYDNPDVIVSVIEYLLSSANQRATWGLRLRPTGARCGQS